MSVNLYVELLESPPVSPDNARRRPTQGGVPIAPGLYAWWSDTASIGTLRVAEVPGCDLGLLYVGTAPTRPDSAQTLRNRICGVDLRGGPATSPLRRTLCALLWQELSWQLRHRGGRVVLSDAAQAELERWQSLHLQVSWSVTQKPWLVKPGVAKATSAPLNLAEDRNHPYHWLLSEARQRLRSAALAGPAAAT
jgi:hypothetical protein